MKVRIALTLSFERRKQDGEEQFEHRDVDTLVDYAPDGPSALPLGFTPDPDG